MTGSDDEWSPGRAAVVAALLLTVHLLLVAYFAPRSILGSGGLVLNDAFAIEAYRAFRARAAFDEWSRLWAYDPSVLAGQSAGVVELFGTRIFVLSIVAMTRFGMDPARAFMGTVVALHATLPLLAYGAARAFGLGRGVSMITMALWSALWFFDSLVHYAWFSGRIGFAVACGVAVSFVGVGSRIARGRSRRWAVALGALGLVAVVLHPLPALVAIAVVVGLAFAHRGILPGRRTLLAGSALAPALALLPMGAHIVALSSEPLVRVFDCGISQALWDVLEVSSDGYRAPGATRAMVRVLVLVGAVFGLLRFRASDDYRYGPLAASIGIGVAAGYFGKYVPVSWPIDPYFFSIFAAFAATVPASALLSGLDWRALRGERRFRVLSLVVFVVAVPRLVRTVATFIPEILPRRMVRSTIELLISPLAGVKEPLPDSLRHDAVPPNFTIAMDWLLDHHGGRGNVLIDDAALAAYVSVRSTLPVVGPLGERGAASASADPSWIFSEFPPPNREKIAAFLERYGVGWVALWGAPGPLDAEDPGLEPIVRIAGVRIRRVSRDPSFFVEGTGRLEGAALGRLRVGVDSPDSDTGMPRVTLRLHFDASLVCRPSCRIAKDPTSEFITIENPPADFDLFSP